MTGWTCMLHPETKCYRSSSLPDYRCSCCSPQWRHLVKLSESAGVSLEPGNCFQNLHAELQRETMTDGLIFCSFFLLLALQNRSLAWTSLQVLLHHLLHAKAYFYRGKVMFLQVSVCPQGGVYTPLGRHPPPPRQTPPWTDTPPPETATAADGTHPTAS